MHAHELSVEIFEEISYKSNFMLSLQKSSNSIDLDYKIVARICGTSIL